MKVLVTGASGFVGQYLVHELEVAGHQVVGMDRHSCEGDDITCDITDENAVTKIISKVKPECVFHLAALSKVDNDKPEEIYRVNVLGTENLCRSCAALSRKIPFVYISSSQVYGRGKGRLDESSSLEPVNHYGASKAAAEMVVRAYGSQGFPWVILRPFNHTGAGQDPWFVVPKIVQAFASGQETLAMGNLNVARDITDVRDMVRAYRMVLDNLPVLGGEVLNIASGHAVPLEEIIDILVEMSDTVPQIVSVDKYVRDNEIQSIWGDASKCSNLTGWRPVYTLRETLQWMYDTLSGNDTL